WHIMLHELWVGGSIEAPWKHKTIGYFQKYLIKLLLNALDPKVLTTSIPLYAHMMEQHTNIGIDILPMFSNIPVSRSGYRTEIEIVSSLFPESIRRNRQGFFIGVNFGSYYADNWDLAPF